MDNQHRHIKGYRELNEEEIDLMNDTKALAEKCKMLLDKISSEPNVDQRSVAIATTNLQQGFMWAVRAVARPETF